MTAVIRAASLVLAVLAAPAAAQTCNTADRALLLVLDASGSMNARLPSGETRFAVAQRAVKEVAAAVPGEARLALRLYGAQSPPSAKDCRDSQLAVPFAPAATAGIAARVDATRAQGYTPIALALRQAGDDFPAGTAERVIVLVSDGKETCRGDPVLAARELAAKGITIHTVGFVVDTAARMQLQTIARAAGGTYFDAPAGPELPDRLRSAIAACPQRVVALPARPRPGRLRTTSAIYPLAVFKAETEERVGTLDRVTHEIALPAGIYEVQFGPGRWRGIEVRPGETTTIAPGELRLTDRVGAVQVVDSETGERFGQIDAANPAVTLMPGLYDLRFGRIDWRFVRVDGGAATVLHPAVVALARGLRWQRARITTSDGAEVFRFDAVTHQAVLPPGDYVVEIDGTAIPFPAAEGQRLDITP